jgi:MFS superfamily sulfate permease-like transporter
MTGVIVRSAANIGAGGRTWRASWTHGLFLTVAVLTIPAVLNRIPLAVLAAILIHTGFKLAHPSLWRDAWRRGLRYCAPFVVTVAAIMLTDLLIGIGVGLVVGIFFVLRDSYRNAYCWERHESADGHHVRLTLAEEVTFLNKAQINSALTALPERSILTVDGSRSKHLDEDVVELLHDFRETARAKGIALRLVGIPDATRRAAGAH